MNVSPAPTVSTTLVGKPGTRVTSPPGSIADPAARAEGDHGQAEPVLLDPAAPPPRPGRPLPAQRRRLGQELMSSSLALTMPDADADRPQPGLHLAQ